MTKLDRQGKARVRAAREEAFEQPEIVRSLASAAELHAFAEDFNWDDASVAALVEVVRHPQCDAGTAKMLYWAADPDDLFSEVRTREELASTLGIEPGEDAAAEGEEEELRLQHWDLLLEIEERLASHRFATAVIAFEPPYEPSDEPLEGRPIPAALFEPIPPRPA